MANGWGRGKENGIRRIGGSEVTVLLTGYQLRVIREALEGLALIGDPGIAKDVDRTVKALEKQASEGRVTKAAKEAKAWRDRYAYAVGALEMLSAGAAKKMYSKAELKAYAEKIRLEAMNGKYRRIW